MKEIIFFKRFFRAKLNNLIMIIFFQKKEKEKREASLIIPSGMVTTLLYD